MAPFVSLRLSSQFASPTLKTLVLTASAALLCLVAVAAGQVNPGLPSYAAFDSRGLDTINLHNLNVLLNIPIMGKSGAFPFSFGMKGNFYVYIGYDAGQHSLYWY